MPQFNLEQDDLYKVLGVEPTTAAADIKKTYRKLAQKYHPDANPGDKEAEETFKKVNAAYDVLKDEKKRKEYDEMRELLRRGGFPGGGPFGGANGPGGARTVNFEDLADLFGSGAFGDLFRGDRARARQGRAPQRGADLEASLHLTFEDAMAGLTTQVAFTGEAACDACGGSGARTGTFPHPCPTCNGRGTVSDTQGFFALSRPCAQCGGEGQVIDEPCPACGGRGTKKTTRKVRVAIPAGVKDGTRVRVKARGEPGMNGGPAGDLYVVVHVSPHPTFGRKGDNLTVHVKAPFEMLALGGQLKAPTLDGTVTLKVPAGTPSGRVFRVAGRGAPKSNGKGRGRKRKTGARGDLLVTVDVVVPQKLSQEAEEALRRYAELAGASSAGETTTGGAGGDAA